MKHKISKEIRFLYPNASPPPNTQVRTSHTLVPHFHYFHGQSYIVPPEIHHTLCPEMELLSHPKPDSIPRHPVL